MQQKWNDLTKYMRFEDRNDADRFAWPGLIHDMWNAGGGMDDFMNAYGPDGAPEDKEEFEQIGNLAVKMMSDSLMTDELRERVTFDVAQASGCPEEPDAPLVDIRVVRPADLQPGEKLPVIFYCYSAGTTQYSPDTFDAELSRLCDHLHCAVIMPCYRVHHEHMFPAPVNDLHAAYLWLIENADEWGFDSDCVVSYGQSWGGLLAPALSHRLKRYDTTPVMRGCIVLGPALDERFPGVSGTYLWGGGPMTHFSFNVCFESYMGYANVGDSCLLPEAWPNRATVEDVKGLPPISIHTQESDPYRDASIQYAQKYLDAGVFCALHVWPAAFHGFLMSMTLITTDDPYGKRCMNEVLADFRGFFDYDFRREF